jgi:predicted DNA-binding protein with PD1-like motif
MQSRLLHDDDGQKTYALVFDKGDELMEGLASFAAEQSVDAGDLSAIGAFSAATVGYFSRERMDYDRIHVNEQVELLALIGHVTRGEDEPNVHAHVVLGRRDGSTVGGHLLEARVWPTAEVVLTESPPHLRRSFDPETGLALIDLTKASN